MNKLVLALMLMLPGVPALAQAKIPPAPSGQPVLAPGLHVQVTDGVIVVTNSGGSLGFQAGQFGYVPSVNQPPVILPSDPGLQFTPPPSFGSGGSGPPPPSGGSTDCIVR